MNSFEDHQGVCMTLDRLAELEPAKISLDRSTKIAAQRSKIDISKKLTKRQISELFFEHCTDCFKMSAVPQGAFAVHKMRERQLITLKIQRKDGDDKDNRGGGYNKNSTEGRELTPLKYNSKLMNSIWGLYNRYSPHNFKKNTDANGMADAAEGVFAAAWGMFLRDNAPPASSTATNVATAVVKH